MLVDNTPTNNPIQIIKLQTSKTKQLSKLLNITKNTGITIDNIN